MKYDKAIESIGNEGGYTDMTNAPKITPEYWWNDIMNENAKLETLWEALGDELSIKDKQEWSKGKWSDMPKDIQNKIDNWARQSGGYEAFAQTGGQYPSMEDDSDDYSFGMPASSPKYASKLKKNYHDNKTQDMSTLNDDANNIGNVDEELKSQELNEWDKPDTLNQKPDKAPLDVDAEPQEEQVEPTMGQESTGYKCRACGLYASSEDSANKHEDQFGKDHKMYYGDVYSKDEEALEAEQDKKYKCPDCKYGTEFPESFKIHARGQHDMGEDQINNIIGEVALENMASDCGCDKGKEKFYKPIFESLGVDWGSEAEDKTIDFPPASRYYECGTCGDSFDDREEYDQHKKDYPGKHDSPNTASVNKKRTQESYTNNCKEGFSWDAELQKCMPDNMQGSKDFNQESFISEWDGMNVIQRHEWLNNKVGIFEMLDKYIGVSNLKFKNQDMASQERLLKLAESNTYSYDFKKKVNVEYYRDPADFPDPHPKSACDICKTQYQDHGDKGDKVSPSIKDEYDLNFDIWSHDWEGEGDYDDSDNEYDRRRDQELEDRHIGEARGGKNDELEVYPGDYVDFGAYGKHYVVDTDYFSSDGRTWWITDDPKDRENRRASGWSISSSQAKRVIQSIDDADEESDEVFTYEEWLKNQASKSSLKAMRNSEDQPEKDSD